MWFLAQEMRPSTVRGVSCLVSSPMRRMICLTMPCWSFSSKMAKARVRPVVAHLQGFDVAAQHAHAEGVEGGDERLGQRGVAEQAVDALGHLAGGLVGEGDGEDGVGGDAFFADEPGDAAGDDARFAGAGAGQDEQRAFSGLDGGALFGIQIVDERLHGAVQAGRVLRVVYR